MAAGRKPKYTSDSLINELETYTKEHPYKQIKYSDLFKATKIPAHIWRDNKEVNSIITKLNTNPIMNIQPNKDITFPSAEKLIETNYKNKNKLITVIQHYMDILNDIYDKAMLSETFVEKEEQYIKAISEKDAKIRKLQDKIKALEKEIDLCYINSQSPKARNELGLKDNLIKFNPSSKQLSKDLNELAESMSSIFSDLD